MVRVKIFNGLGNQLFQYACGRAIQEKFGGELILDISDFEVNKRKYGLCNFKLNNAIKVVDKDNSFSNFRKNWLIKIIYKFLPEIGFFVQSKFGKYLYFGEEYKEIKKNFTDNYYLYGYWQCERYFEEIKDKLKEEIVLKNPLKKSQVELVEKLEKQNSVMVHIRRGDYVKSKYYDGICDENYYKKAIKIMQERLGNPTFFVFSDEIEWVKNNWTFLENAVFVDEDNKDFEELEIMSHCKNFIIANSSFSWWAQYLSNNEKKIVVAPQKWNNSKKKNDIYMDNWIKI